MAETKCPTCGREECRKDAMCYATRDINSLVAAVRSLAKSRCSPVNVRTALAIVESIRPSGASCPECGAASVVYDCQIKVHFARITDQKPCRASFGTLLGGVLLEKK